MSWFRRDDPPTPPAEPSDAVRRMLAAVADLQAQVAALDATVKAQGRDLDDLDDSLRRFKGRRAKDSERHPDATDTPPPNGARRPPSLPTVAQLRAVGKLKW